MTRCQVGDLAVIVGSDYEGGKYNGSLVHVVRPGRIAGEWFCEPLSPMFAALMREFGWPPVKDSYLRPIRPQPDDAEDESLSWLPSPAWELADGIGT